MDLSAEDRTELRELEESMWRVETRFDPEWMDQHLAAGFREFGRSGRAYEREETLDPEYEEIDVVLPLPDYSVVAIAPDVALATYRSIRTIDGEVLHANRSSVWVRVDGTWKMRFHQGTPTKPGQRR